MKRSIVIALLVVWVAAPCAPAASPIAGTPALSADDAKQLLQAEEHYRNGKFNEALTLLKTLREKYPAVGDVHRLLGHCYYELGKTTESRAELVEAIGLGRMTADVIARVVQIDRQLDRPTTESAALLNLLGPDNRQNQMLYADALMSAGSLDEAERIYKSLLKQDGANPQLWLAMGNVHLRRSHHREAAAAFETAYHLGDTTARLPQVIGDLWRDQGDPAGALSWYDRAAALKTEPDPALDLRRADLALTAGLYDRAQQILDLLAQSPDRPTAGKAHLMLGRLAVARGREADAVKEWEKAIALGAEDRKLLAYAGTVRYNAGDYAKAAEYLSKAASGGEPDARVLQALALSLLKTDQREAAGLIIRRYIEQFGVDNTARELTAAWAKK